MQANIAYLKERLQDIGRENRQDPKTQKKIDSILSYFDFYEKNYLD